MEEGAAGGGGREEEGVAAGGGGEDRAEGRSVHGGLGVEGGRGFRLRGFVGGGGWIRRRRDVGVERCWGGGGEGGLWMALL